MGDIPTSVERLEGGGRSISAPPLVPRGDEFFDAETVYTAWAVLGALGRHEVRIITWVGLLTLPSVIVAFFLPPPYGPQLVVILDTCRSEVVRQPAVLARAVAAAGIRTLPSVPFRA